MPAAAVQHAAGVAAPCSVAELVVVDPLHLAHIMRQPAAVTHSQLGLLWSFVGFSWHSNAGQSWGCNFTARYARAALRHR